MQNSIAITNAGSRTFYSHADCYRCDDRSIIYDGKKIAALRNALGLKQAELARRASIKQPTLWAIENQMTKQPEAKTLLNIALALGVPLRDILKKQQGKVGEVESDMADVFRLLDEKDRLAVFIVAKSLLQSGKK